MSRVSKIKHNRMLRKIERSRKKLKHLFKQLQNPTPWGNSELRQKGLG